jgi:hypothetical protein
MKANTYHSSKTYKPFFCFLPQPTLFIGWWERRMNMSSAQEKGSPAPIKRSSPPGPEAGEGVKIEYNGGYCATTNKRYIRVLYSINKNKFVKGYFKGDRVSGDIVYNIFPGRYIVIVASNYPKLDPPKDVKAMLVSFSKEGKMDVLKERTVKFYSEDFLRSLNLPPQLLHVWEYVPGYHAGKAFDFNKVFSEEETRRLLEWIDGVEDVVEEWR